MGEELEGPSMDASFLDSKISLEVHSDVLYCLGRPIFKLYGDVLHGHVLNEDGITELGRFPNHSPLFEDEVGGDVPVPASMDGDGDLDMVLLEVEDVLAIRQAADLDSVDAVLVLAVHQALHAGRHVLNVHRLPLHLQQRQVALCDLLMLEGQVDSFLLRDHNALDWVRNKVFLW